MRKQRYVEIDYILRHPSMQLIGLTVVVYAIWYVVYRKNSNRFDEYLELQAEKKGAGRFSWSGSGLSDPRFLGTSGSV